MTVHQIAEQRPPHRPDSLDEALVQLQARMPRIRKSSRADVKSERGQFSYTYADLAKITEKLYPLMTELGLSFTAMPDLWTDPRNPETPPRAVLRCQLRHVSGDRIEGVWPLTSGKGAQGLGSDITYGRRYALVAVTGCAPDDDDDAAAAEEGFRQQARQDTRQPTSRQRPAGQRQQRQEDPAQLLAEAAVTLTETEGKTVDDLKALYEQARESRILTRQVKDPVTGDRSQLTQVISRAKNRMTAQAEGATVEDPA